MSAIPIANGGLLHRALDLPDFAIPPLPSKNSGLTLGGNVPTLGNFLREVMRLNMCNFRAFGPDETQSNRLEAIYEAGRKVWLVAPGKGHCLTNSPASNWSKSGSIARRPAASAWNG